MSVIILYFLGGIGLFLFGITLLSNNVIEVGGNLFKYRLNKILANPLYATGLGLSVTVIIQSSSATNSFTVRLADKGLLDTESSYYIVMGANIGTTITAYLAVLAKLNFTYLIAAILFPAAVIFMTTKNYKLKNYSKILSCLSLVFIGLIIVKDSLTPLHDTIYNFLSSNDRPLMLFLFSLLITIIFQSSSLTSVLLVTMAGLNIISIQSALLMVMAINIGTCFSVLLAGIGCSLKGWSVAIFHLLFNVIGTFLHLFLLYSGLLDFIINARIPADTKIALYHTFFNATTTLFVFYFIPQISSIINKIIKKRART
ncbi:MAG: Na/Pi symporter [Bacillota bacterium]|jgi:phosphate:Na+ symporter|nr:Na/Pi symporter [Bacillota bacterium]HHU42731.1 Na/Pi cotransporter family protein [Clostridiales bacterium]